MEKNNAKESKSYVSKDDILDVKTEPRPLILSNVVVGYFGELIINISKYRVASLK